MKEKFYTCFGLVYLFYGARITMIFSIKQKHHLIIALVTVMAVGLMIIQMTANSSLTHHHELENDIKDLNIDMLSLRRAEKDFLARKLDKYRVKFEEIHQRSMTALVALQNDFEQTGLEGELPKLSSLERHLEDYKKTFLALYEQQKLIGFDHKSGLHGSLRNAVHEVESIIKKQPFLMADMLMLRRNEKDFMARLDPKYIDTIKTNTNILIQNVKSSDLSDNQKADIVRLTNAYLSQFLALADAEVVKGLDHNSGIHGDLRSTIHKTETTFEELENIISEKIERNSAAIKTTTMITTITFLTIIIGFIIFVSRSIHAPLSSFRDKILAIADTNDLTGNLQETGDEEIRSLARSFNTMIDALRETMIKIESSANHLVQATDKANQNISHISIACDQQTKELEQASAAVEEMTTTVAHIAENANNAAQDVSIAKADVNKGHEKAEDAKQEMSDLIVDIENAVKSLTSLEENSNNIAGLLDEIQSIAEQTNLLALNAAIEAARAGEQGRGFAVVADEVRTLASRTQASTESIRSNIAAFQQSTTEMVDAVNNSRDRAQSGKKLVTMSTEALASILEKMQSISEINHHVATASEEQSYATEEISQNVTRVNEFSREVSSESLETLEFTKALTRLSEDFQALVRKFKIH